MSRTPEKQVVLYTDGACSGNPGPGGYGVVLLFGSARRELSAGFRWTTNNRMELLAVISAVTAIREPCRLLIHTDSRYVLDAFGKGWLATWRRNGWMTAGRTPVRNRDLWERLDSLLAPHTPTFRWVKGHSDVAENERCDRLAVEATRSRPTGVDETYESTNPYHAGGRTMR